MVDLAVLEEADRILSVLKDTIPRDTWHGEKCVTEMRQAGYPHWAQEEWPGWYFEYLAVPRLVEALDGQPLRLLNTTFDYSKRFIWDLKVHSSRDNTVILNSVDSTREALDLGGFGFIVLSADATYDDDGSFKDWHREQRISAGKKSKPRTLERKYIRRSKSIVIPKRIDIFFAPDAASMSTMPFGIMNQGRHRTGAPRGPKYKVNINTAKQTGTHLLGLDL